mgnify:CR=1 FL=1
MAEISDVFFVDGMRTPAFDQSRIVHDPTGSGLSEHAVHHFHGLKLDAYRAGK